MRSDLRFTLSETPVVSSVRALEDTPGVEHLDDMRRACLVSFRDIT